MNQAITLPQTVLKRLEKVAAGSRRTPQAIIKQAVIERINRVNILDRFSKAGWAHKNLFAHPAAHHYQGIKP